MFSIIEKCTNFLILRMLFSLNPAEQIMYNFLVNLNFCEWALGYYDTKNFGKRLYTAKNTKISL